MARGASKPVEERPTRDTSTLSSAWAEADLIDQCRRGDTEAFSTLVLRYQDRIYNVIVRMVGRNADAEELTQDTFLKAFEKLHLFRGTSRFYTWVFRIATNQALSYRRRGSKVKFISMHASDDKERPAVGETQTAALASRRTPSPEAAAMAQETAQRIDDALLELDEEFRVVVVLRDIETMDYTQIADVLDVPVGTVKSRLHRGRCMLKEKLIDLLP